MKWKRYQALPLLLLLLLLLGACCAGRVQTPTRTIAVTLDDALAAQNTLLAGVATGQVALTEAQFSSLLTKLLEANSGPNSPVESISTWIEPEQLYFRVTLKEGVLAAHLGHTLDLAGSLAVEEGLLKVGLAEAAVGPYVASGALLQPIADQINGALAQQLPALPIAVALERGVVTISLAQ
ncbi:MAG: hypothetical protein KF832_24900 [Caldilineaceae bacterium]|nr:hypothetical protein [Caldilineaceae bacterium]